MGLAVVEGFDVFMTPDQNLRYQQNIPSFNIAVVVLAAGRNVLATYRPLAESLLAFIETAEQGEAAWFTT